MARPRTTDGVAIAISIPHFLHEYLKGALKTPEVVRYVVTHIPASRLIRYKKLADLKEARPGGLNSKSHRVQVNKETQKMWESLDARTRSLVFQLEFLNYKPAFWLMKGYFKDIDPDDLPWAKYLRDQLDEDFVSEKNPISASS